MKQPTAKYKIADSFKITGRGLIFAGAIIDGEVNCGDMIEFIFSGQTRLRKIKSIEMIRTTNGSENTIGLVISCFDQKKIDELNGWISVNQIAIIHKVSI
ncbi:MAG: hypothetical protein H0W73_15740 [Bacteroidetes bacterium]|nr:hypothetical protein [Bacteroidota bacterium]